MSTIFSSKEVIHYRFIKEEIQRRHNSKAHFHDRALCGYGKPIGRIKSTRSRKQVTCPACLLQLGNYENYS